MKLFLKILFFLLVIFSANISEAKTFAVVEVISETTSPFTFAEGKNNDEFRNAILENDFGISCKSEGHLVEYRNLVFAAKGVAAETSTSVAKEVAVHGNSLKSLKPTWGYKLYSTDGTFLKNGITSKLVPESRYTKSFMSDKFMEKFPFSSRLDAWKWEFHQNQILRGPLNKNMH